MSDPVSEWAAQRGITLSDVPGILAALMCTRCRDDGWITSGVSEIVLKCAACSTEPHNWPAHATVFDESGTEPYFMPIWNEPR